MLLNLRMLHPLGQTKNHLSQTWITNCCCGCGYLSGMERFGSTWMPRRANPKMSLSTRKTLFCQLLLELMDDDPFRNERRSTVFDAVALLLAPRTRPNTRNHLIAFFHKGPLFGFDRLQWRFYGGATGPWPLRNFLGPFTGPHFSWSLVLTLGGASNKAVESNSRIRTRKSIVWFLAPQWYHHLSQDIYWSFSRAYQWFICRFLLERHLSIIKKGVSLRSKGHGFWNFPGGFAPRPPIYSGPQLFWARIATDRLLFSHVLLHFAFCCDKTWLSLRDWSSVKCTQILLNFTDSIELFDDLQAKQEDICLYDNCCIKCFDDRPTIRVTNTARVVALVQN